MRALLAAVLIGGATTVPASAAGIGTPQDRTHDRTLAALQSLAERGSARAQFELASILEGGLSARRDARSALAYYCMAARQSHPDAAYRAGQMLLAGHGVGAVKEELGRSWLRLAASLGNEPARRYVTVPAKAPPMPASCEPQRAAWRGARTAPPEIKAMVARLAPAYGVDTDLVLAVIAVESGFRTDVVSPKQAMGLMQLIPETAARFGVRNVFDPEDNIRGGIRYLRWLLAYFDGDVRLALAGYNAGEGAVLQHKGVPPYRETKDYVERIGALYRHPRHPFDRSVAASAGLTTSREQVAELSVTARPLAVRAIAQPKRASMED